MFTGKWHDMWAAHSLMSLDSLSPSAVALHWHFVYIMDKPIRKQYPCSLLWREKQFSQVQLTALRHGYMPMYAWLHQRPAIKAVIQLHALVSFEVYLPEAMEQEDSYDMVQNSVYANPKKLTAVATQNPDKKLHSWGTIAIIVAILFLSLSLCSLLISVFVLVSQMSATQVTDTTTDSHHTLQGNSSAETTELQWKIDALINDVNARQTKIKLLTDSLSNTHSQILEVNRTRSSVGPPGKN